jgi:hypothetical protein
MVRESELPELLIFDLETSGGYPDLESLRKRDPRKAALWETKCTKAAVKDPSKWSDPQVAYQEMTPLSPEFGRIVCASFLHIVTDNTEGKMKFRGRYRSFYDTSADQTSEEELVLKPTAELLNNIYKTGKPYRLCGHNIKKFDVPFLAKRMIMNNLVVPPQLQTWGKKPWELDLVDTGELWAMGAWDQYVSLDLLASSLGIPSPKENMKGEYVGQNFWSYGKYKEIKDYCEEDVKCVARICHRLSGSIVPLIF